MGEVSRFANKTLEKTSFFNDDRRNSFTLADVERYFTTNLWKDYHNKHMICNYWQGLRFLRFDRVIDIEDYVTKRFKINEIRMLT